MATIRTEPDRVTVSGILSDGSQFRKTFSRKRYGSGFKKIAQQKYEELLFDNSGLSGSVNNRQMRTVRQLSVAELAKRYVEEHLCHTRARNNKSYIETIVKKWGEWRLGQISIGVVRPWIRSYLDGVICQESGEPYSAVYAKKLVLYFRRLFNWGCESELFDRNPLDYLIDHSLRKEFARRIRPRRQTLTAEQFEAIVSPSPLWFQRVCRHAWGTGMREGEIASLRWDMIRDGLIYLEPDRTKEADTKVVPMEPEVSDQIAAIWLEQSVEGSSDFVYLGGSGKPLGAVKIASTWWRYRNKAGFTGICFHDIRRTWQNRKEQEGHSLRAIAAALGHHSTDTTARHYRSVSESEIRRLSGKAMEK